MRSSKISSVSVAGLASVILVILLLCCLQFGKTALCAEEVKTEKQPKLVECIVTFGLRDPSGSLQLVIKDEKTLKRLIEEPIRNARPNPNPASYLLAGSLDCKYSNGVESVYGLFLPWGYYKVDSKFLIADLRELKNELTERIEMAKRSIDRIEADLKNSESGMEFKMRKGRKK
jgi:hypothetical protein